MFGGFVNEVTFEIAVVENGFNIALIFNPAGKGVVVNGVFNVGEFDPSNGVVENGLLIVAALDPSNGVVENGVFNVAALEAPNGVVLKIVLACPSVEEPAEDCNGVVENAFPAPSSKLEPCWL